jgi:hypothetical protein
MDNAHLRLNEICGLFKKFTCSDNFDAVLFLM